MTTPRSGSQCRRHRNGEKKATKRARQGKRILPKVDDMNLSKEANRILRDDGALTVMFTHKKQEAWETLFDSWSAAGSQSPRHGQ